MPRPRLARPAGQDLLSMIRVFKNDPAVVDETVDTTYMYTYACMANVAIWINGTEVVHTASNNITTLTAYSNGTVDAGSVANALTTNNNILGLCGDSGVYYM
jgi:hypothetical protein